MDDYAKRRAEMDQLIALMVDSYPPQWRQLYLALLKEGFSEGEAIELLKTYITATCSVSK